MKVDVRPATSDDLAAATTVERLAFEAARGGDSADDIVRAIEEVHDLPGSLSMVAVDRDTVVGHAQFSRAWVGETPVLVLGPLGVTPGEWRRGIGSRLVILGLEEARARGEIAVLLVGDPGFYQRFGFVPASRFGLRNPVAGVQPNGFVIAEEHLQIAPLDERASSLTGEVVWHSAL